jgi:hypothetical protein
VKPEYKLSVIIAVQYAQENLPEILNKLDPAGHQDVEFLFCSTEADPATAKIVAGYENTRVISGCEGSLIPHLWRDGIIAAQAEKVALGTAHCIPAVDWVDRLFTTDMTSLAGIGGIIENDEMSGARDWAVYLLRYISFAPPQEKRQINEIAADNAIYRRSDIMQQSDLLEKGFWEPSFHTRFRQAGMTLELDPSISVMHSNRYSTRQFFVQRLAHGKEFGLARAREIYPVKRWLLIVLSPLLPVLFLKKIVSAVMQHGKYKSKLLKASPWLLLFLFAWGLGEAMGYLGKVDRVAP